MPTTRRSSAIALLGAGLLVVLAGCSAGSGGADGPAVDVVTQIGEQLDASGLAPDPGSLSCAGTLPAQTGATVRCTFTAEAQPVDLVARAAAVNGSSVDVEITTEARPVPKAVLESAVADRVGLATSTPVNSTVCAGDLPPTAGASTTCEVESDGAKRPVRVSVTSIDGGAISYTIDNP